MTTLFKKAWMDMKKTSEIKIDNSRNAAKNKVKLMMQQGASGDYIRQKIENEFGLEAWEADEMMGNYREKAVDNTTARNQRYEEDTTKAEVNKHVLGPREARDIVQRMKRQGKSEMEIIHVLMDGGFKNIDAIQLMEDAGFYKKSEEKIEKPGDATHSTKWDDCVKEAQAKNPKSNVYAICTAQLGEESFKSQYRHLASMRKEIREARKAVGTSGFAGGIPNSLLADQDLEGVADDSEEAIRDGENR